jgi:cell division transport system permease protein
VELIAQIGDRFKNQEGVKEVVYGKAAVDALLKVTRALQLGLLVFAGVLLLSSGLLILNTIRMAIYNRRREVAVMKLVGATDWFIRVPFMVEGLLQGLVGGLFAFAFVYTLRNLLSHVARNNSLFRQLVVTSSEALGTGTFIVVVGAAIGAIGSAVAVTRFLDV